MLNTKTIALLFACLLLSPRFAKDAPPELEQAFVVLVVTDLGTGKPIPGAEFTVARVLDQHERHGLFGDGPSPKQAAFDAFTRNKFGVEFGQYILKTGVKGKFLLRLPAGMKLEVRLLGQTPYAHHTEIVPALWPGERRELNLTIPPAPTRFFRGQILAQSDGTPIAGAEVRVLDGGPSVKSDDAGFYTFGLHDEFDSRALVSAEGFGSLLFEVDGEVADDSQSSLIKLAKQGTLLVKVIDPDGTPVSGIYLDVADHGDEQVAREDSRAAWLRSFDSHHLRQNSLTDSDGYATINGLGPGRALGLTVRRLNVHEGQDWEYAPHEVLLEVSERLILEPGETRSLELSLPARFGLAGKVTAFDGRPLRKRRLWVLKREDPTERGRFLKNRERHFTNVTLSVTGRFMLPSIPAGDWWLAIAPRGEDQPILAAVHVDLQQGIEDLEITMPPILHIEGSVTQADGAAAQNVTVTASRSDFGGSLSVDADEAGNFLITPLPAGSYDVLATTDDSSMVANSVIDAGQRNVRLTLDRQSSIQGSIANPGTGNVTCFCLRRGDPRSNVGIGFARDGVFILGSLKPGTYDLIVHSWNDRIGLQPGLHVETGKWTEAGPLILVRGGTLQLKKSGLDHGLEVLVYRGEQLVGWGGVGNGSYLSDGVLLPPGDLLARVITAAGETVCERRVHIAAGAPTWLSLDE